jgi:hypothetical protein
MSEGKVSENPSRRTVRQTERYKEYTSRNNSKSKQNSDGL